MDNKLFVEKAKKLVKLYLRDDDEVFLVWLVKVLQSNKCLIGTRDTVSYFEVTYNGDKNEFYVDNYDKLINEKFSGSDI